MITRILPFALANLLALTAMPSHAAQHALVVTIENFPGLPGASNLPGCHLDGDNIVTLLKESLGFPDAAITRLRDNQATTPLVLAALHALAQKAHPNDAVFLYFSTHGTAVPDFDGDEGDGYDECLLTPDFDTNRRETWLVDDRIGTALAAFRSNRVTLVVDACHSGTIERDLGKGSTNKFYLSPQFPKFTTRSLDDKGGFKALGPAAVVTACGPTEPAIMAVIDDRKQSLFTFAFTKAVPDNLNAPFAELAGAISELVANAVKGDDGKPKQTPQFTGTQTQSLASLAGARSPTIPTPAPSAPQPPLQAAQPTPPTPSPTPPPRPQLPTQAPQPAPSADAAPPNALPSAFPITLAVDSKVYDHGSLLNATVTSPRSGHLKLYYIDSEQNVSLIFPNKFHQDDRIAADAPVALPGTLPFKFRVKHPAHGSSSAQVSEILLAVICEEPFTDQEAFAAKDGETFKSLGKVPVAQLLDKGVKVASRDKAARAALVYQINP